MKVRVNEKGNVQNFFPASTVVEEETVEVEIDEDETTLIHNPLTGPLLTSVANFLSEITDSAQTRCTGPMLLKRNASSMKYHRESK